MQVLVVDEGGTHVKILATGQETPRQFASKPTMTAEEMVSGENAAAVRLRITEGLEFLGIELDQRRNVAHAPVISREGNPVTVRVMRTDEDLRIARHTRELMEKSS